MKALIATIALLIAIPSQAMEFRMQSKSEQKLVEITTDCWWVQKDAKNVVLRPIGKLRKHGKVMLIIDGEKMICNVKDITRTT